MFLHRIHIHLHLHIYIYTYIHIHIYYTNTFILYILLMQNCTSWYGKYPFFTTGFVLSQDFCHQQYMLLPNKYNQNSAKELNRCFWYVPPRKGAAFIPRFGRLKEQNLQISRLSTPWKIQQLQSNVMEVDGKWCSFPIGWFLGSMLIFRVALNCIVWIVLDSEKSSFRDWTSSYVSDWNISMAKMAKKLWTCFIGVLPPSFRPHLPTAGNLFQKAARLLGKSTVWLSYCTLATKPSSLYQKRWKTMKNKGFFDSICKSPVFRFVLESFAAAKNSANQHRGGNHSSADLYSLMWCSQLVWSSCSEVKNKTYTSEHAPEITNGFAPTFRCFFLVHLARLATAPVADQIPHCKVPGSRGEGWEALVNRSKKTVMTSRAMDFCWNGGHNLKARIFFNFFIRSCLKFLETAIISHKMNKKLQYLPFHSV